MARPVCITYDSTCDLTPALLERFQIRVIPLTIIEGEQTFLDDGSYTSEHLYETFRRSGTLPKTAAVSPQEFLDFFLPILAEGMDIVHIDISSELSCTCQNAVLAAQELKDQGQIHVVDSRQLSTGGGLLALQGAKLRDSGMAAADIAATPLSPRALPAAELGDYLKRFGKPVTVCADPAQAAELALAHAAPEDVICAVGSLYMAGAIRMDLRRDHNENSGH